MCLRAARTGPTWRRRRLHRRVVSSLTVRAFAAVTSSPPSQSEIGSKSFAVATTSSVPQAELGSESAVAVVLSPASSARVVVICFRFRVGTSASATEMIVDACCCSERGEENDNRLCVTLEESSASPQRSCTAQSMSQRPACHPWNGPHSHGAASCTAPSAGLPSPRWRRHPR